MAAPALRVFESHARNYRRNWRGSAVSTFLTPIAFLLAMGMGLGTLVDDSNPGALDGLSYLEFLAPGLLAATVMQTTAAESSWPVMLGIKWEKTYEAALATPVAARDLLYALLGWVAVRATLTAVVFLAVMAAFGAVQLPQGLLAVGPAVLVGMAFAAPIAAFTARIENDYALAGLFRFVIVPLFLFSGTFFPISQMPEWLQPVAYVTPLWHGVELCRALALGLTPPWPHVAHAGYLLAWILVGTAAAVWAFQRRLVR